MKSYEEMFNQKDADELANALTRLYGRYYTSIKVNNKWVVTDKYSPV